MNTNLPHDYREWASTPTKTIGEVEKSIATVKGKDQWDNEVTFQSEVTPHVLSDAALVMKLFVSELVGCGWNHCTINDVAPKNSTYNETSAAIDALKELHRAGIVDYNQKTGEIKVL